LQRVRGVAIARGAWHTARVTCIGSDIRFYLDGALTAQASDDTLTHGIVALRAGQGRMLFDDHALQVKYLHIYWVVMLFKKRILLVFPHL
ncbi:hypothetical protein, partial [Winogradskyella sp.]|uniref:hypothetical protein n=1 Tax=Winogradskyella sp. TaxID=1883156 RepID=UPI0035148EDF